MISIKINDINNFMNKLLIGNTFDEFLLIQADIDVFSSFSINGKINKPFFNNEELSEMSESHSYWSIIKPVCYSIIKGSHVPTKLKIVFGYPHSKIESLLNKSSLPFIANDIGGLYINIIYENNSINIITGTNLYTFSLDKSLEKYWDESIKKFLLVNFDCEEND